MFSEFKRGGVGEAFDFWKIFQAETYISLISKLRNILVSYINNPPTRLNFLGVNFHALAQARKERNISRVPSSVVVKPTRKSTSMTMGNLIARNARNVGQSSFVSAAQTRARGGKTRKSGRKSGRKTRKAGRKN